jgi:16S rRNA (guanine966-N2)-methyltransferase
MRVVAGQFRGRRLQAPPGETTRPILDRAKVALFDWLGAQLSQPGDLPPIHVLDMFCGAGSLGIEALSRGVASCTFVEKDKEALQSLRMNLAQLGISGAIENHRGLCRHRLHSGAGRRVWAGLSRPPLSDDRRSISAISAEPAPSPT